MKKVFSLILLPVLCGCLSSVSLPESSCWLIEYRSGQEVRAEPKYGVVRLSQVIVNPPYGGTRLVVLRKNGTVAFDANNVFAAPVPGLLKGPCMAAMKASGLFSDVVGASSGAMPSIVVELVVTRLALDCRQEDSRRAVVEMIVRVLNGKSIVATAVGEGMADAGDGDYGTAFSKAVSAAVSSALSRIR